MLASRAGTFVDWSNFLPPFVFRNIVSLTHCLTRTEKMSTSIRRVTLCAAFLALGFTGALDAQARITSPREQFGFDIGDDYKLVNYTQVIDYWKKLDAESDRMTVEEMGRTAEGRPQLMAVITAPENQRNIEHYRDIAQRLALAEGLTDEQAHALAAQGKAVVWIDGGLHADEVLGAQQLLATVYGLVSGNDPETRRILNDVIVVAVWANPDGMELVSNWYMREADPLKRSTRSLPRLYQKYIGHDNNRDFYMSSQPETRNMNRVMYHVWFPQIVYNHHQTGPAGTVMFAPPFRDPFNYNLDPLVVSGIDMVGAAMQSRFLAEDKPGVTVRSGSSYSTWWNGGLRTTAYFHNMIGLLTETIGNPTPLEIPFMVRKQLPSGDLPEPIEPQKWHFKQSIDYSVTANRAVLDYAQRYREQLLFNIYRMGRNSIERGSHDNWTASPKRIEAATAALTIPRPTRPDDDADNSRRGGDNDAGPRGTLDNFRDIMRNPMLRDARAYIIPSDQPDFLTATKFVNTLIDNGITVLRATRSFQATGKTYPAGSYVIKTAQPFRPHILDMFEPQDHPNDIPYPGGPPKAPYDNAGYTLAYQMGVRFDRILDGIDGPFQPIVDNIRPSAGRVIAARGKTAGYLLSHDINDAFTAVNRLLAAKEDVYWLDTDMKLGRKQVPAGTFFIAARQSTLAAVQKIASETGIVFEATTSKPKGEQLRLRQPRIGLWDRYGGSIPSGWTRFIFEQFGFPYEVVYPPALDAGNLNAKYDALVFVTDALPANDGFRRRSDDESDSQPAVIPPEYNAIRGEATVAKTVPQLRSFMENGGTLIAEGTSTSIGKNIGLPVHDALTETVDGRERHLPRTKYYVPGSVLEARVDKSDPVATGITDPVNVFYDNSPAFRIAADSTVKRVAWYASATPLRSGWAWGQKYLENATAIADASVGKGHLYLFGPELTFRAQSHGTFKFLFNALLLSSAERARVK